MTLRQQWATNRMRRAQGLPEVDRNGNDIAVPSYVPMSEEELLDMCERTAQSYDPSHPRYVERQGD
jgi:hypothetical protein